MIINHNIAALNTYRQLSANSANTAKSLEKLSSGLQINKAGDDPAGLAISEKMRGQIRGLDQAAKNSQDAISLIQTAEGALSETHSILQRMRELAVQSANDTNVDSDRNEIQKEINQLTSEINRVGNTTEFNTRALLKGDISSTKGIVTAGTLTAGGTGLSNVVLNAKSTAVAAGDYKVTLTNVTGKSIDNKDSSIAGGGTEGIGDISITSTSTLDNGKYNIAIGTTTVQKVDLTAPNSAIGAHIDTTTNAIAVQAFSALQGDQTFAVNRTDVAGTLTANGTGITAAVVTGATAPAAGDYKINVAKEVSGIAAGNTGVDVDKYVTDISSSATATVSGADIRLVFQERTDNDGTAAKIGTDTATATTGALQTGAGGGDTLTITAGAGNGTDANAITVKFVLAGDDNLTASRTGLNEITISYADTTATNNSAANIQAAIRGIGTVDGVDVSAWTVTGAGSGDTGNLLTTDPADTLMAGGVGAIVASTTIGADETTVFTVSVGGRDFTATKAQMDTFDAIGVPTQANVVDLLKNMEDGDGNKLSSVLTITNDAGSLSVKNNSGVVGNVDYTITGTGSGNIETLTGITDSDSVANNATARNEFQVRLYNATDNAFVSDAVILDNAQQDYSFFDGATNTGISFTTVADVNTTLNADNATGKYMAFDVDTKISLLNADDDSLVGSAVTLAAGAVAGETNINGVDIAYGAADTLNGGNATFSISNELKYVWGGDFGEGGNEVAAATLTGAASAPAQALADLNADATVTINVDGIDFTINAAALAAEFDGTSTNAGLKTMLENAGSTGFNTGTKLSDVATVEVTAGVISITGKLVGADGNVTVSVDEGTGAGTTTQANMETALGLSDGDTATGVGNAGTTFAAGDELSLTGGVTLTTASDIADYDVGSVASTINIGSDSAFVATLNYGADHTSPAHTAGTQVAGTAQIIVDANQNYNFGQGVSFDTSAAGLANSNQISFNIDSATVVKAELQFDAPGGAQSFSTIETIEDSGTHLGEEGAPTTSGTFSFKGGDLTVAAANLNNGSATFTVSGGVSDEALLMQIGANNGQNFSVGIDDMRASALGISGSTGAAATVANAVFTAGTADVTNSDNSEGENALDVSTFAKATAAIEVIDKAITTVSAERSKLGAFQNRLEHTINNLGTTSENLTASESRIRDVDMAKEMMEFTKNNILSQAAQAMLAQANQQPQGVLQLLR